MKRGCRFVLLGVTLSLPLAGLLMLASCRVLGGETEVAADCGWDAVAKAWLDKNRNGKWDPNEPPLAGGRFFVDDTLNHYTNVGKGAVTNQDGQTSVRVWLPGCPAVEFEIYATPPAGYRLTSPARMPAHGKTLFEFGFVEER